ncbi:hypothetical protein ACFFGR_13455 [Arthrobacter liuii]|uniref:hypothetical protein n=1 Tax=Arthrobacter liuii TaxID=1476996 RepID=UPI001665D3D8|nr:hypothetical protein [Arthrobacter liuii]
MENITHHPSETETDPVKRAQIRTGVCHKSALAEALREVHPRVRKVIGIPDAVIAYLEVFVLVIRHVMDDHDGRPWQERLDFIDEYLPPTIDTEIFMLGVSRIEGLLVGDLPRWTKLVSSPQGKTFLRRLAGAAAYDKIESALRSDGALLVIAFRRFFRSLTPVAVALDDCVVFLTPHQMREIGGLDLLERSALNIAYQVDAQLDRILDHDLPLKDVPMRDEEARTYQIDVETLANQVRPLVSGISQDKISEVSAALSRKMSGARQALATSDDGCSQAANSLIEFIDRLLRQAFSEAYVLEWTATYYPGETKMTFEGKAGNLRPTKRAQALCFAHGGQIVEQASSFHRLAAAGLNETRARLQKIKHSDNGTLEEKALVETAISAVEGFFLFAIRAGWADLQGERLEELRTRM